MDVQTLTPVLVPRAVAAQILGVSSKTVKRLARDGHINEVKLHPKAHPRLRLDDVLELAQRSGSNSP